MHKLPKELPKIDILDDQDKKANKILHSKSYDVTFPLDNKTKKLINESLPYIDGPTKVSQYSKAYYSVKNITGGEWLINWKDEERSLNYTKDILPLEIPVGELDSFILIYRTNEQEDVTL